MAEREGFEPRYLSAHPISSRAHSTTLPPLQSWAMLSTDPVLSNLGIIEKKENWRSFLLAPSGKTPIKRVFGFYNMISGTRMTKMKLFFLTLLPVLSLLAIPVRAKTDCSQSQGIMAENCFDCHGPDKAQRKAKLRLDVGREPCGTWAVTGP